MIPVLIPDMPKTEDILPYLRQIDTNRQYTNFGPLNSELEQRLTENLFAESSLLDRNALTIVTIANATLGLEVLISLLGLGDRAKVLVPSLTFPATATALIRQNFVPVFSDVHPDTWLLTPEIARVAVQRNPDIRLIVPVATFGLPVPVEGWDQFVEETGIPVVIDAAGAFGNQKIGKRVHIVFSLHATKALGAGEGGFIATPHKDLAAQIKINNNFGIDSGRNGQIYLAGTNAKLSEYHAAVALASLDQWPQKKQKRLLLIQNWMKALTPLLEKNWVTMQGCTGQYCQTLLPLRFPQLKNINSLISYLSEAGIQTRRWYYPLLPKHPALTHYPLSGSIPVAENLTQQLLGLPFHLELTEEKINYIVHAIAEGLIMNIDTPA